LLVSQNIDALGNATKSWTDAAGRAIRSMDQLDKVTSVTYDTSGNQLSVRDANSVGADMLYDSLGRNTQRTDTFGDVTKTEYDRAGNAVKQIDAKNKFTLISFDSRNRRKSTTDRIAAATNFIYTALGQLASLTDAENQTTAYTYDVRGSKLTEQYPDHVANAAVGTSGYGIVTFAYDNAGRVARKQDQAGDTCTYNYDLAGRMTSRNYRTAANSPTGTIADSDTFTFDRAGRMLTAANGRYSNTVAYTFDPVGRKASESLMIASQTYIVGINYNNRGELIKYTYPDGSIADRSYYATGALSQLKLDGTTVSTRSYDNGRRMTSEVLGNGITETRAFRNDNLLSTISYSNTAIGNLTYSWDANKNKTSESISGAMSNYGFTLAGSVYDNEDRLTGFQRAATSGSALLSQSWNLTSVGDLASVTTNGTAQTRTHGPTHELLTAGSSSVTTDVKGNMTGIPASLREASASGPMILSWDYDNKLKFADIDNNGSVDVSFQYDALGRRVARTGTSGSFVYFQVDQQTIADYGIGDAPTIPLYRYVYGSYIDEPVVRKGAGTSGTIHYYHRNQQYSVYAITSSIGTIAERYAYTAYGQPTILDPMGAAIASSTINNRYIFTGREWDATIGLHHFRARWLSGLAGRFSTRDPIGYNLRERNLSSFLTGRTLIFVDPLGNDGYAPPATQPYTEPQGGPKRPDGGVWIDFPSSKAKRCVFYRKPFKDDITGMNGVPTEDGCKVFEPTPDKMIDTIEKCECCEIVFAGHQSGDGGDNPGGVRHMIDCKDRMPGFWERLRASFLKNCSGCSLVLAACGSEEGDECRERLAKETRCDVYGTKWPVAWADPKAPFKPVQPCTLDPKKHGELDPKWSCKLNPFPFYKYPGSTPFRD
jgi:RHS repeat-associated protein